MTEKRSNWISHYKVHSFHCNNKGIIRLSSIAKFLQEIAWEHAESCGAGYHSLQPEGLMWILYGLKMEIENYPNWNDTLQIETWGKHYENLFAYRDFELKDVNDQRPLIRATSSWLLVDADTHRPQRITSRLHKIPALGKQAIEEKPGEIKKLSSYQNKENICVVFSDIDIYNHVNNTSYIQYCVNSSPDLQKRIQDITSFNIRFVQESHLDDELEIRHEHMQNSFYFVARKKANDKEVFRAEAELKE
ncbi:MAG: acyl-[acyl-carrier-protein] thioesterase [Bacteroidota bacterium]